MLSQKSVLIVEDNCFVALDLAFAIEEMNGIVVGPAATVDDALSLLGSHQIAGAVLDCHLIDRDAAPVIKTLVDRGVPLVVYTGTGLPVGLAAAYRDVPVLTKPLRPEAVVNFLVDQIANGRPHPATPRNVD